MGKYLIKISTSAEKELSQLKRSGKKADIEKVTNFFKEISEEPRSGTGKPETSTTIEGKNRSNFDS